MNECRHRKIVGEDRSIYFFMLPYSWQIKDLLFKTLSYSIIEILNSYIFRYTQVIDQLIYLRSCY
jgi:hypothetical protein